MVVEPLGPTTLPGALHLALRALVACPRGDRRAVRIQRRTLSQHLAGLLAPLVLSGSRPLRPARPIAARRPVAEPQTRGADDADRHAPRGRARHRPGALERLGLASGQLPDALPARHARDRDGRVAVPGVRLPLRLRAAGDPGPTARARDLHGLLR